MKRSIHTLLAAVALATGLCGLTAGCDDDDSYADDLKRERKQIQAFLKKGAQVTDPESGTYYINLPGPITPITEEAFYANDSTTDVAKNEFVLFSGSGIYMQIVRKGTGKKLQNGESTAVICRYTEFNIAADTIQSTNLIQQYASRPEVMNVTNTSGTFTAQFTSGLMRAAYGQAVPGAWLIPLTFVNLGRQASADEEIALVRLIVPSREGQDDAKTKVYPCYYEVSYQRGR
ncbi:MAG: DUF4827 domain-containing protein [Alloprevotella sp.]|nr:DUF4827 domain-containing protein [Alloprevotella sp.]